MADLVVGVEVAPDFQGVTGAPPRQVEHVGDVVGAAPGGVGVQAAAEGAEAGRRRRLHLSLVNMKRNTANRMIKTFENLHAVT